MTFKKGMKAWNKGKDYYQDYVLGNTASNVASVVVEAVEENTTELHSKNGKKIGRPQADRSEKGRLLKELKDIWSNKKNRPSDIVSAASKYAEIIGFSNELSVSEGKIMKVEFSIAQDPSRVSTAPASSPSQDSTDSKVSTAPSNKMIADTEHSTFVIENKSDVSNVSNVSDSNSVKQNVSDSSLPDRNLDGDSKDANNQVVTENRENAPPDKAGNISDFYATLNDKKEVGKVDHLENSLEIPSLQILSGQGDTTAPVSNSSSPISSPVSEKDKLEISKILSDYKSTVVAKDTSKEVEELDFDFDKDF